MRLSLFLTACMAFISMAWMVAKPVEAAEQIDRNRDQIDENRADISRLAERAADQDFILKLLAIILPTSGTIVVAVLQLKTRREVVTLAHSVNGMKDELVVAVRSASFQEGQTSERLNPESKD